MPASIVRSLCHYGRNGTIHAAPVPEASKDITVTIGSGHFASVLLLYSTVRHEFVHVDQIRADFLGYIPSELMPRSRARRPRWLCPRLVRSGVADRRHAPAVVEHRVLARSRVESGIGIGF